MGFGSRWFGSSRRIRRAAVAVGIVLLAWFFSSLAVAYRLTHRPRARFDEPAPQVAWGPLEDHRITTSDGQKLVHLVCRRPR